jgi:NAD(P)-dependent dehydrogenase (short-subunit alcohol dehydrogenase family)
MLKDRIAVIVGASSGIGAAIGRLFAQQGCRVVLAARRRDALSKIAAEIGGTAIPTDVRSEAQVAALFRECERIHGRLDVLVNSAGVVGPTVPIQDEDMASWDETFSVNVRAVALAIKHAVPLLKQRGGAIVNIASDAVLRPKAQRTAYAASKCAVVGLTQAIAQELGPFNIRANVILPGATRTEMLESLFAARAAQYGVTADEIISQTVKTVALRRIAEPGDIAALALFLASDFARAVTGSAIVADGGRQ